MTSFEPPRPGSGPSGQLAAPRPSRAQFRRRRIVAGAAVIVVLGGAVAIALTRGGDSERTAAGTPSRPSSPTADVTTTAVTTTDATTTDVTTTDVTTTDVTTTDVTTTDATTISAGAPDTAQTTVHPATTASVPRPTFPPGPNVLGIANGKLPDPASAVPEERFVAHLGTDATAASPGTPAAIYAEWWQLFLGPAQAVASPTGFLVTDGTGQRLELSGFGRGADGQVSDAQECVLAAVDPPLCNRLSAVISLDPTAPVVGQSPVVQFSRLAELRLLRTRTVRFVTYRSVQPIAAATSPTGQVRLNDHLLAFEVPKDAPPLDIALTVTYADSTSETLTVGL